MPAHLRLMDLPTEVLRDILSCLHPPGPYRRCSILSAPPSFHLAVTCNRFLSIFRSRLHTVDAIYPDTYAPIPTSVPADIRLAHCISAVLRLAHHNIKVLRMPRDCVKMDDILAEVAARGVRLEELAYYNTDFELDETTVGALFRMGSSWKRLNIFNPTAALKFIHHAKNLEHLELTGILPRFMFELISALFTIGRPLRVLKIGFQPGRKDEDPPCTLEPGWCIRTFAEYICQHSHKELPRLRVLDINDSRSGEIVHSKALDREEVISATNVAELERTVRIMRERNAGRRRTGPGLRELKLRLTSNTSNPTPPQCLQMFDGIIRACLEVEVQIVGVTVVFPPGSNRGWLRALQLTRSDLQVSVREWGVDVSKIQILDLGTKSVALRCMIDVGFREKVLGLVGQCAATVKEVRVEVELTSVSITKVTCVYVAKVLEKAVNVERVYIRTGLVDFAVSAWEEFQKVMRRMREVRVLRLTIHPCYSPKCKMPFGRNLPLFLDEAVRHCSKLECLFLESSMPVPADSIASSDVRELAMKFYDLCLAGIERFEGAKPGCDISSVKSQLAVWFEDLNPESRRDSMAGSFGAAAAIEPWAGGVFPPALLPPPL